VYWPGQPDPTRGRDAHQEESEAFIKSTENHLDNDPYRVMFGSGDWTCTIARWKGKMIGPWKDSLNLDALLPDLEALYKDVHAHPELSMQEKRTAALAADRLRAVGYEVTTGVGRTGVVGLLRNGDGPPVMLRADMDALPVEEATGLPYASKVTTSDREGKTLPVGHMCGHDMHVTWLAGATKALAETRKTWHGTLMAVFQPGEETAEGARAMIEDGLLKRFPKPDVILGQHVMVGPAGTVAGRAGVITSAADSLQIRLKKKKES